MDSTKYIGMDVHKESISVTVRNAAGKVVMECVIETKANMILQFIDGLRGDVHVTFEEGTWAAWLNDLLRPHVTRLVVCDPRRNALLQEGNQNDRVDAGKLAELLQNNQLRPVYHGDHGLRTLKELVRMLGGSKSRGYCLEMICADFLAGANLENPDPSTLSSSVRRFFELLPTGKKQELLAAMRECA